MYKIINLFQFTEFLNKYQELYACKYYKKNLNS